MLGGTAGVEGTCPGGAPAGAAGADVRSTLLNTDSSAALVASDSGVRGSAALSKLLTPATALDARPASTVAGCCVSDASDAAARGAAPATSAPPLPLRMDTRMASASAVFVAAMDASVLGESDAPAAAACDAAKVTALDTAVLTAEALEMAAEREPPLEEPRCAMTLSAKASVSLSVALAESGGVSVTDTHATLVALSESVTTHATSATTGAGGSVAPAESGPE